MHTSPTSEAAGRANHDGGHNTCTLVLPPQMFNRLLLFSLPPWPLTHDTWLEALRSPAQWDAKIPAQGQMGEMLARVPQYKVPPPQWKQGCPCLDLSLLSTWFTVSLAGVSPVTCLACTAWHFGGGLPHPGEGTLVVLHLPACSPTLLSNVPGIRRDTRAKRWGFCPRCLSKKKKTLW